MEEVGMQVASPLFIHQNMNIGGRFCDGGLIGKKRGLCYSGINHHQQQQHQQHVQFHGGAVDGWSPKDWEWDSARFVARARPAESDLLRLGNVSVTSNSKGLGISAARQSEGMNIDKAINADEEDGGGLQLQLGGVGSGSRSGSGKTSGGNAQNSSSADETTTTTSSRPNKKVRSGSPGSGGSYPMCQVDCCSEDLSKSKDYHRRHKVCEFHSKATKALVGKQMQRFCQQCSRFHPLPEFDEGKRSCRRRLAGHNRRRRKTQAEDATSPAGHPTDNNNNALGGNLDIVNLLTVLARGQGNTEQGAPACPALPEKDQLLQILSKINSLPRPTDKAAGTPTVNNISEQAAASGQSKLHADPASRPTTDLLAVLSAKLSSSSSSSPNALAFSSQKRNAPVGKNVSSPGNGYAGSDACKNHAADLQLLGGERSSPSYQSPAEDSDCQVQDADLNLPLQLFSSSPGNDSPPNFNSSGKYFSSDSSNPTEEGSPSSSPPVTRKLFPLETTLEAAKPDRMSFTNDAYVEASQTGQSTSGMTLELFSLRNPAVNDSIQSLPYRAGYTSSSGSDHSPPSFNSDPQRDRTDRIIFKLFDKDPSSLPGTLRTQIYNWLSNSPSDMESYIRPGCVALSLYVSMPSAAWEQLEENFLQRVHALLQDPHSEFWRSGRFSVNVGAQLAFYKDGKVRACKPWSSLNSPELLVVSPLAIVSGEDASLVLKGRNLTTPGTKIHCTYMGEYISEEVIGQNDQGSAHDEIELSGFKVHAAAPSTLGRCFIEVENGLRGSSFPVIIADAQLCQELRLLECEFNGDSKLHDVVTDDHIHNIASPKSHEEVLHFLNELGWLFQRQASPDIDVQDYGLHRCQFLLIFSVERDYCALVKTLLDIFAEMIAGVDGLSSECLDSLGKMHLLHRAVKRRSRRMVDLLIQYSLSCGNDTKYIFPPNLRGPGGITPLHLAACTSGSYDIVDVLTEDPMQIGLSCWNSLLDDSGQSPYEYAAMRNNHSLNQLVAQKLDRMNGQVSLFIGNEIQEPQLTTEVRQRASLQVSKGQKSCSKCAAMTYSRMSSTRGLLHRPFVHSMLAIAAVCVCVCVFFKSFHVNKSSFQWEHLHYGAM